MMGRQRERRPGQARSFLPMIYLKLINKFLSSYRTLHLRALPHTHTPKMHLLLSQNE